MTIQYQLKRSDDPTRVRTILFRSYTYQGVEALKEKVSDAINFELLQRYTNLTDGYTSEDVVIVGMQQRPVATRTVVVGTKLYGTCSACGKMVQMNKAILGSLHFCE